ncbi:MAG: efflux RND transporter periplasmic adaptor subunit, partial [Chromatiales bacterium]|nr:efflux RND transporter periplasmic adaptor subunit [Chromatiales bacterium]
TEAVLDESRVLVFLPDDGLLEERTVTTGMSNWDHTEVLSGIEDGELVVTSVDKDGVENGALAQRSEEEQK